MTQQALNSIDLYSGNDPEKIKMLLRIQENAVVDELMEHFDAKDIEELAIKLSMHY